MRKLIRLVVLAALFAASGILHPAAAKADEVMGPPHPFPKQLSVVQLGDSFSAGNGAGSYYGAAWCERSAKNWGQNFVESASSLGIDVTYVNRACSGGVLEDIFAPGTVEEQYSSHLTRCRCVWCFLGYYPRFCCGGGMSCCIIFTGALE